MTAVVWPSVPASASGLGRPSYCCRRRSSLFLHRFHHSTKALPDDDDDIDLPNSLSNYPESFSFKRRDEDLDTPLAKRRGYIPMRDSFSPLDTGLMNNTSRVSKEKNSLLKGANKYIVGGIFILGIGTGIAFDTVLNAEPNNVASREVIDRQTPNPDVCIANGMSAMVLDQRLYISFNPFNVYVSQAEVKPGCVLLQSNWNVLESRGLVSDAEVKDCFRNFNTFGFVGDLRQAPEVNCIYHSERAENLFLKDPAKAALGDGFQPKSFEE